MTEVDDTTAGRPVRTRFDGRIAVIVIDRPPVNALGAEVRGLIASRIEALAADPAVDAIVLAAVGRHFSAGADIHEFGRTSGEVSLGALCDRVEGCAKPVVAALQGPALSGGAELALAAHDRIAAPDAALGFPEIRLGLLPGAGGTQRLPRLVGAAAALDAMILGKAMLPGSAESGRLFDRVAEGDVVEAAVAYAGQIAASGRGPRRTTDRREGMSDGVAFLAAVQARKQALAADPRPAARLIVDCVEASLLLPMKQAMTFESEAFARCLASPELVALRHLFQAERRADPRLVARDETGARGLTEAAEAIADRLASALHRAAVAMAAEGVDEAEIDGAMRGWGFAETPFGSTGVDPGAAGAAIRRRILAALVAEGARAVETGAARRPADIDVVAVHGMGFPRLLGGPMRAAQTIGLLPLKRDMERWAKASPIWSPPDLLIAALRHAEGFDAANRI